VPVLVLVRAAGRRRPVLVRGLAGLSRKRAPVLVLVRRLVLVLLLPVRALAGRVRRPGCWTVPARA